MESYAYDYDSAKVLQNFVVGVYLGKSIVRRRKVTSMIYVDQMSNVVF